MMGGEKGNSCITLHQPWASLLVHGIKRIEGRSWSCPMRGRLWIHAASKVPERETIEAMEEFYRDAYELDGVTNIVFPEHYPTSVLLGCVEVVGCLYKEEVESWEELSAGVRMEALTDFCWLCEDPQRLVVPLDMRGRQGVYPLTNKMLEAAPRALRQAQAPIRVKFPVLNPADPFSLEPGSLQGVQNTPGRSSAKNVSPKLDASIAGARAASLQFRQQDDRARQQGPRFSSPGSPNLQELYFRFAQNTLDTSYARERGKTLQSERGRPVIGMYPNGAPGSGSMPINVSRQAPQRVVASRIFDQAMGGLGPKGPQNDDDASQRVVASRIFDQAMGSPGPKSAQNYEDPPQRVKGSRIFDQAMGSLGPKSPQSDEDPPQRFVAYRVFDQAMGAPGSKSRYDGDTPQRVVASRIFDQAMGALGPKSRNDEDVPQRVVGSRIFDQAMGALGPNSLRNDEDASQRVVGPRIFDQALGAQGPNSPRNDEDAPQRVIGSRIFNQAMGALGPRNLRN